MSQPFQIHKTLHTGITVSSIATALRFWQDLIGATLLYRRALESSSDINPVGIPDAAMDVALLALPDGSMIELLEYTAPPDRAVYKPRPCDVGSVHVALGVTGSEALIAQAEGLGWKAATAKPQRIVKGDGSAVLVTYMHGPHGETVELMEDVQA